MRGPGEGKEAGIMTLGQLGVGEGLGWRMDSRGEEEAKHRGIFLFGLEAEGFSVNLFTFSFIIS